MELVRPFKNGGSRAIRIPKEYDFGDEELVITKVDGIIMIMPKRDTWATMFDALGKFSDDFLSEPIEQLPAQERIGL